MIRRIVRSSFNATHAVVLPDGREPLHGHDWRVQVECELPDGVGVSGQIAESLERVLAPLRHIHLNDIAALRSFEATAESVARYLFDELTSELARHHAKPVAVELEEEPGCRARYEIG